MRTASRAPRGVVVSEKATGTTAEIRARYVVVGDGQNSRVGRDLGTTRKKSWPMGMALRGYYTSERHDEPWIDSHLDIRDPKGDVVPGYGWIFPLGDGRVNVGVGLLSTGGAWKGVNTTKLQEYFVAQVADAWGLNDETCCGPPTGGRLPMGLAIGPARGCQHADDRRRGRYRQPLQRRGHRLRLRVGSPRGGRARRGAAGQRLVAAGALRRPPRRGLRRLLQGGARLRARHLGTPDPERVRRASDCASNRS